MISSNGATLSYFIEINAILKEKRIIRLLVLRNSVLRYMSMLIHRNRLFLTITYRLKLVLLERAGGYWLFISLEGIIYALTVTPIRDFWLAMA